MSTRLGIFFKCYPRFSKGSRYILHHLINQEYQDASQAYVPNVNYVIRDFCIEYAGISLDMVERLSANEEINFIDEENCYIQCILTESGYLSENGEVKIQKFAELKKESLPEINLDCLRNMKRLAQCSDVTLLRKCGI